MPDSGHYGISGRVVLVIARDNSVLGTITSGSRRYEIRGEITNQGVFRGILDGEEDYDVSGTLLTSRNAEVSASWTLNGPGDVDDTVMFRLGQC